ncbi:hypothetical protein PG984_012228 [Apiospora sp. TS-2023a]
MDPTSSNTHDPKYLHVPFGKRWECHRNTIHKLYMDDRLSIKDIVMKMKDEYSFDADARQYKHHFKKWGFNKNISATAKEEVIKAIEKKQRKGKAVAEVRYKGGPVVDKKKLVRHLKSQPQVEPKLSHDAMVFARWNFPHHALQAAQCEASHHSPTGTDGSTPSDISMPSPPQMPPGASPSTARSPINAPTPTTVAIRDKTMISRATSLLDGRYGDFLKNMSVKDRKISIAWLDQFWYFSFKTFKHWGKGPRFWTADILQFGDLLNTSSSPNTPGAIIGSPNYSSIMDATGNLNGFPEPTDLCRWSIHVNEDATFVDESPSPPGEPMDHYDINDPESWPSWPQESPPVDPITRLQNALHTNEFSSIEADQLPLSSTQVAKAAAQSPDELVVESVGFAIMARNVDLLMDLLARNARSENFKLEKLYPFHLAATYLDGAKSCCDVMRALLLYTRSHNNIRSLFVNNLGHTVLDSLMMTILKAHSSCLPEVVDEEFRGLQQFAGGESWKHMFCHTSVQAICHSIVSIYSSGAPNIPSGLFVKSCGNCGKRLQPSVLHTLVLTTFFLAQNSCEGETLFGALACLVCLLAHGADPHTKVEISVQALLGADDGDNCTHEALDPLELARLVPQSILATWTKELQLGWDVFVAVLQLCQNNTWTDEELGEEANEDIANVLYKCLYFREGVYPYRPIGPLWASIQTEFLTYRRLTEGDSWISENFSMTSIIEDLRGEKTFTTILLISRNLMKPHCTCGRFVDKYGGCYCVHPPTSSEACADYFSNLEDWNRSTFLVTMDIED